MANILGRVLSLTNHQVRQCTRHNSPDARQVQGHLKTAHGKLDSHFKDLECQVAHDVMEDLKHHVEQNLGASWKSIGFKDLSNKGFDTRRNGHLGVDYGNKAYTTLLLMLCREFPESWGAFVEYLSQTWLTLHPDHPESARAIERKGDLVETILAFGRGEGGLIFVRSQSHNASDHNNFMFALRQCAQAVRDIIAASHKEHVPWRLRCSGICLRAKPAPLLANGLITAEEATAWEALSWKDKAAAVLAVINR